MPSLGKRVGAKYYVHAEQVSGLPQDVQAEVHSAARTLADRGLRAFNVIRIDPDGKEYAFLNYPVLGQVPFPALHSSWRIAPASSRTTYRNYADSLNPPILHRTELLLPDDHPNKLLCRTLTETCERIGLFDDPTIIGFEQTWRDLIRRKGYELDGFELRPIGNAIPLEDSAPVPDDSHEPGAILRHLTALSRSTLSAPVQSLVRDGLLSTDSSLFDYGCGKGDDVAALLSSGFSAAGWDPYFRPDSARTPADVVNLGFVINVIEDLEERITALSGAFSLTRRVLAVAAMLSNNQSTNGHPYKDGIRTSRNTFQKYYTQAELQQFLENVLDEDAYPAAPGVFYVFRDHEVEQRYLLARTSDRSRVARARLAGITYTRAPTVHRIVAPKKTETPEALAYLDQLWRKCIELGRPPVLIEMPDVAEAREHFRSPTRALTTCLARNDRAALERAEAGRCDDILVMLALRFFERRRRFMQLEPRLQTDVREFFGSYQLAEAKAQALLFSVRNPEVIHTACERAAADGLGWLEPGQSLQLHTSLVERLPAPLRVYVGCATTLAGDLKSYDLVKVHIQSGKVTLMSFDDFLGKPLPLLQSRVKVRLKDQDVDFFTYTGPYPPTVLYYKSRYINEEFPRYAEQLAFEEALEQLGSFDMSGYGLPQQDFDNILRAARHQVAGFRLIRSNSIPALDDQCGARFSYRAFIECGESWRAHKIDNTPRSPETYNALCDLARYILDPLIDYFGGIKLTYAFASKALTKGVRGRISPSLDQHAGHEHSRSGKLVCPRGGAAVDFLVEDEDMLEVANWIAANLPFDRLYYYGPLRPIHVSYGPQHKREFVTMREHSGRLVPSVARQPAARNES